MAERGEVPQSLKTRLKNGKPCMSFYYSVSSNPHRLRRRVKKIEEIAAVDGVGCIQMGPLDLSASLEYLWDPGNKKVKEMMNAAEKLVFKKKPVEGGAYLSGFAMPHDSPENLKSRGYHMVSGAVDIGMFRNAAVEDVKKFKMSSVEGSTSSSFEFELLMR
ncbi:hypothetical protein HAX54_048695 [Datura stramonium]|uniref:HpcH/HpaI aldolase/citrate lyase domain-containing protein n=1 Tax=Datura stramonium TaxID=4076 RepID=A0ABS8SU47_DATST|nr:hypothetical protein [Datura stramonium]